MTLPDALARLCELEPERFKQEPSYSGVYYFRLSGASHMWDAQHSLEMFTAPQNALLSAALQELVTSKGWDWERVATKYEGDNPHEPSGDLPRIIIYGRQRGKLLSRGRLASVASRDPLALVLARAVLTALEAER